MEFRTEVNTPQYPFKLDYSTKALLIGSCFTANIGSYLQQYKFNVDVNPFGAIYNPASIVNSLNLLLENKAFESTDLLTQNDLWFSYAHHSLFSSHNKDECLQRINSRMRQSSAFLQNTNYLFITLGTAYAYRLKQSGKVVNNCHKTPANEFERQLLSPNAIVDSFIAVIDKLLKINPDLKIVFTVSPIRHLLKDDAHGNQISKACLLLAINKLQECYKEHCFYFGAYEIMLDDLRDYRFYAEDMCHPSNKAIQYIWQKFKAALISSNCTPVIEQLDAIIAAVNHRPFNPDTSMHKVFIDKTINKIELLLKQYPQMDFTAELEKIKAK